MRSAFTLRTIGLLVAAILGIAGLESRADSLKKSVDDCSVTKSVTVGYGKEYTFWVDGLSMDTAVSDLSVEGSYTYKEDGETWEESVFPSEYTVTMDEDGNTTGYYALLTADDWEGVPSGKSITFKCVIDGWYDFDNSENNKFSFHSQEGRDAYPEDPEPTWPRAVPAKHEIIAILDAEGGEADVLPGYLRIPGSVYGDEVIDQSLCKVVGRVSGRHYVFRTEGADTNLLMRLYDRQGRILAESRSFGKDNWDVTLTWRAESDDEKEGPVYLGVCQDLEDGAIPSAATVKLKVATMEALTDSHSIRPFADMESRSPASVPGQSSASATLDAEHWVNRWTFPVFKDIVYRIKAGNALGAGGTFGLEANVSIRDWNGQTVVQESAGSVDPLEDGWLEFTASADGIATVEVKVAGGSGYAYGTYNLFVSGSFLSAGGFSFILDGQGATILSGPESGEVTVPSELGGSAVTKIGDRAFSNSWIERVGLPDSLVRIGDCAFNGCKGLYAINIPSGVAEIGENAFSWCENLVDLRVAEDNGIYSMRGGVLCDQGGSRVFCCPGGATSVNLPADIREISSCAFVNCQGLTEVVFPAALKTVGDNAFRSCRGLKRILLFANAVDIAFGSDVFREVVDPVFEVGPLVRSIRMTGTSRSCLPPLKVAKRNASAAGRIRLSLCGENAFGWMEQNAKRILEEVGTLAKDTMLYPRWKAWVRAEVALDCEGLGTVVGGGVLLNPGQQATVTAFPVKGHSVFIGWFLAGEDESVSANPSISWDATDGDVQLEARFISIAKDRLRVVLKDKTFGVNEDVFLDGEFDEFFEVDSCSIPTVTVSGLPTGLRYDAKTRTVSGRTTKEGAVWVTVSAKNVGGYEHSMTKKWVVGNPPETDYDNIGLDLSAFDAMATGRDFYWNNNGGAVPVGAGVPQMTKLAVTGLPAGLALAEASGYGMTWWEVTGVPTKVGVFTVIFTATYSDRSTRKAVKIVTVADSGSAFVSVEANNAAYGVATGTGVYRIGAAVKLTAKAEKGYVFAGWNGGAADSLGPLDRLNPTLSCVKQSGGNEEIVANFIPLWEDRLWVGVGRRQFGFGDEVKESFWDTFSVDSGSLPTVTVSGLPTGLKCDAKAGTLFGKPTKEGIYWVTISAKNAGGYEHSAVARWTVGYPADPYFDDIGLPSCGDGLASGERYEGIIAAGDSETLTIKGLPAGLAVTTVRRCCGLGSGYLISGTLTKPGVYTVEAMLTRADRTCSKSKKQVVVRNGGSFYTNVRVSDYEEKRGTVTGLGVLRAGATTKLTAKAEKGYVFAGWSGGAADSWDLFKRKDSNLTYAADCRGSVIYANFIPVAEDAAIVLSFEGAAVFDNDGEIEWRVRERESEERYSACRLTVDSQSFPTLTFKGLPSGCVWDQESASLVFAKAPSKPGSFDITVTAKNASGATATRTLTVVTANAMLKVKVADGSEGRGTVTGGGGFTAGTKVKITAKANKGFVFAGWSGEGTENLDWIVGLNPALEYTLHLDENALEANFIPVRDDFLSFDWTCDVELRLGDDVFAVGLDRWVHDTLYSGSFPTVAVSGLPDGIKFDAKTLFLSGSAKKTGVYFVTVSAKNAGGYVFDQTVRFVVGGAKLDEPDEIGPAWDVDFSGFDGLKLGEPFEWSVESWMAISASGLPTGLALVRKGVYSGEEPFDVVRGTPTKAGKFTLKFTMKDPTSGSTLKTQKTIIVRGAPSGYVGTGTAEGGTVTGAGVYGAGATVKLVAKPSGGFVFAGWYEADGRRCAIEGFDYRMLTLSYLASGSRTFVPKFVTKAEDLADDYTLLGRDACSISTDWRVDELSDYLLWADSLSLPKLTVKGLPAGTELKGLYLDGEDPFPVYIIRVKDKSKLKPGRYPVTVTAENQSKVKRTWTFTAIVPNLTSDYIQGLDTSDEGYQLWLGVGSYATPEMAEETGYYEFQGLAGDVSVGGSWSQIKVNGLPTGMKFGTPPSSKELCCGIIRRPRSYIYGTPTKLGTSLVTVTLTSGKQVEKATAFATVNARPSWAVGTFGGYQVLGIDAGEIVTLTAAADGKVSGKIGAHSFTAVLDRYFVDRWGSGCCGFAGVFDKEHRYIVLEEDPDVPGVGRALIYTLEPQWEEYWSWWRDEYAGYGSTCLAWQNPWKLPDFGLTGVSGNAGTLSNGLKVQLDGKGNAIVAGGVNGTPFSASFPVRLAEFSDYGEGSAEWDFEVAVSIPSLSYMRLVGVSASRDSEGALSIAISKEN